MKFSKSKLIICILSFVAFLLCFFPLMSVYVDGKENTVLTACGFNLMECSALGVVPLIAPLLVPIILYGHQNKASKERCLIVLLVGNLICYVDSFNATKEWFGTVGSEMISYYPMAVIYPVCFVAILIAAKILKQF